MSKELLPCPFCGGEAEIERMGTRSQSCQVACTNCGAHHEGPDEDEHSGDSWNRRAALDGEWQSERPAEGLWLVSVHPDQRGKWLRSVNKWPIDAAIWAGNISIHGLTFRIDDEINQLLSGALWQRRTVPRDPFAKEANHE